MDVLSISLNSATPEDYDRIATRSSASKPIRRFCSCKGSKGVCARVVLSVVDTIGKEEIEKCRVLAETAGTEFRVRKYIP